MRRQLNLHVVLIVLATLVCGTGAFHRKSAVAAGFSYRPVEGWPRIPEGWTLGEVSGVAVQANGNVLIFNRGEHPLLEFKPDGAFLRSWGEGTVTRAHGLRVDADGDIWTTDVGAHTVTKYSRDGKVLMALGEKAKAGEDASHFNQPADVAFAKNGDLFVADGYGNSRVAKFDKTGKFIKAWGKRGTGPGEFHLVHAVALDSKGLLYVADRENNRIQVFDQEGNFIKMWTHLGAPFGFFMTADDKLFITDGRAHKVTIVDRDGKIVAMFGSPGTGSGEFQLPHAVSVSSTGEVYVTEITNKRVQKFRK